MRPVSYLAFASRAKSRLKPSHRLCSIALHGQSVSVGSAASMNRCCCCKSREGEKDPKLFKPRSERKCTDCLFCILFAVFWVGMVVIAGLAVQGGNPERLLYGVDHNVRRLLGVCACLHSMQTNDVCG